MKYCEDCKFFKKRMFSSKLNALCTKHNIRSISKMQISRDIKPLHTSCQAQREFVSRCGEEGKWWVKK